MAVNMFMLMFVVCPEDSMTRRSLAIAFCLFGSFLVLFSGRTVTAEDRVVLLDGDNREIVRRGEVLDYSRETLNFRTSQGREIKIPAARVIQVEPARSESHRLADQHFAAGEFRQAQDAYRAAFRGEKRTWVRREILSQIVKSYTNSSNYRAAGTTFLLLLEEDPATRHFDAIPLVWKPFQPSQAVAKVAQDWLANGAAPAKLIGASWLLSTSSRSAAINVLQQLRRDRDRRVAQLALTQLWRTQLVTTRKDIVLHEWTRTASVMPFELRGGPHYLIGRALRKHGETDRSVLELMRVPIQYAWMRDVAAESIWEAANQLEQNNRSTQALRLYRELVRDFPETMSAEQAEQRLAKTASRD